MATIAAPWDDTGQIDTPEGVWKWFQYGRRLFLFLVIIALVITFPLPEPDRDWDDPGRQPIVETAVSESSPVVHITVTANPDYHVSN